MSMHHQLRDLRRTRTFVAAITFAAFSFGLWQESIWYRRSWLVTLKTTIDGVLYGCVTAAAFAWLWPR